MHEDDSLRVSVVIPVYNEEAYIGACLESLMKQNVKPDEIIVIDNNSTDNSVAIAQKYPVRIIHEKIQGMTPARNRGFNEARYAIIARTDADTILPVTWIKRIKKNFCRKTSLAFPAPQHSMIFLRFSNVPLGQKLHHRTLSNHTIKLSNNF